MYTVTTGFMDSEDLNSSSLSCMASIYSDPVTYYLGTHLQIPRQSATPATLSWHGIDFSLLPKTAII